MRKFVVWGCKLHEHTNSYIYAGFHKAALAMGLDAHWMGPWSSAPGFDFSNTLFLTEGQHDEGIPLRDDCQYVLHNCSSQKYEAVKKVLRLQTYTYDADHKWSGQALDGFPGSYVANGIIWQPWATDLLPDEIDLNWADSPRTKEIHWVGTIGDGVFGNKQEIDRFRIEAEKNGCFWFYHGPGSTSFEENRILIQRSFIAPTITGKWQTEMGYIPCRIFKNSSYGHLMATNNRASFDVMNGIGVYDHDPAQLFYKALVEIDNKKTIRDAMLWVKEKHTFVNRINSIMAVI